MKMSRKIKRNALKREYGSKIAGAWRAQQYAKFGGSVKYWLMRWANLSPQKKRTLRQMEVNPTQAFI